MPIIHSKFTHNFGFSGLPKFKQLVIAKGVAQQQLNFSNFRKRFVFPQLLDAPHNNLIESTVTAIAFLPCTLIIAASEPDF